MQLSRESAEIDAKLVKMFGREPNLETGEIVVSQLPFNAFTVDVEDYFHVSAFSKNVSIKDWDHLESRVVANTHRILELLDHYQVRGTFFVLGWVAERYPGLVREIHRAGHEIGSHSFRHQLVYNMTPDEFREDLILSCKVLEEITGEPVRSYRAPSFSITEKSLWALDILIEEGISIDSSIYPIRHDVYGIPGAEVRPHRIQRDHGHILEFPGTVCSFLGMDLPVGGGGYFRILPASWTFSQLEQLNEKLQRPFNFYIHPWEIDPQQPRIATSWRSRFRHYTNLGKTESRLRRLLEKFQFQPLTDVVSHFTPEERIQPSNVNAIAG